MRNIFTFVTKKRILYFILAILGAVIFLYALLWAFSFKTYPMKFGVSFSPEYAVYLGLNPDETLDAILSLKPAFIRLAVPWNQVEPRERAYNFSTFDLMLNKAKKAGVPVVLTVGQKVPRWPECHFPSWTAQQLPEAREADLLSYIKIVVNRYKDDENIELWQVENEPFINFTFGECAMFNSGSIAKEVALVRQLDPTRKIVMTDSGEPSTWREAAKMSDIFGTTLYRTIRINDSFTWKYDWLPPAAYKFRAWIWGKNPQTFFVSELQAEPWFSASPVSGNIDFTDTTTFTPERFDENVAYAKKVGASRSYLWGAEWWYYMKTKQNNTEYWTKADELFQQEN